MDRTIRFPAPAGHATISSAGEASPEQQFLAHLPAIERCVAGLCARHGLSGAEADDFSGWVKLRLVEHDYAVLRKFSGRSSITTYLAVVIANLLRDHRVSVRGRWRPSAAARRLGHAAERLERLVYRQRLAVREAVAVLRSEGETMTDRELAELFQRIPVRLPLRPHEVDDVELTQLAGERGADAELDAADERSERDALRAALARSLDALPAEDRLIMRMRFWDDMSVADVARALGLPQKPLYRRIERNLVRLRERLLAEGVQPEQVLWFITSRADAGDFDDSDPSMVEA
jgi:RNA polymerase sigma factor for flagellar operon FliA